MSSSTDSRSACPASRSSLICGLVFALFCAVALGTADASAQSLSTLYAFTGSTGANPSEGVIADASGNLYGTTDLGGANGAGSVFKLTPTGIETVLYSFTGGKDGGSPDCTLVMDSSGDLYGTTNVGGSNNAGTVFEVTPAGAETVLYSFTGGKDGANPHSGLIMDASGNLYGTTAGGGANGVGTVFEVTPAGVESVLYSFAGGTDGAYPYAGLVMDSSGNLYGTTLYGGADNLGTVFELTPAGAESVLHPFIGGNDGAGPYRGLVMDASGNLYGTTQTGGAYGAGTVFEVTPTGTESVLYPFSGGSDGGYPYAGLIVDASDNLFGTTFIGGAHGAGTVFKVTPGGAESIVYSFTGGTDGAYPQAGLIADSSGNLYSTTNQGGADSAGTVFELSGSGFIPPLHFAGVPGAPNCTGMSISNLAHTYGGTARAAEALGYSSVSALHDAVAAYCSGS